MATDAMRPQMAMRRERPANPAWDRIFFSALIVSLWASVLFGFTRTYFGAGMIAAPLPNKLIHVHGAVFTLWMVLLVVQEALVAGRKIKWHMQLGLAGFGLAAAMLVLGLMAAVDQLRRGVAPPGLDASTFFTVPLFGISTFAVLVTLAYRMRFKAAAHKRLIVIATIGITGAAIGRWPVAAMQANPMLQNVAMLGFLLLVVGYDLVALHRVHKVTLWASVAVMAETMAAIPLGFTPAWHAFAHMMGGKG